MRYWKSAHRLHLRLEAALLVALALAGCGRASAPRLTAADARIVRDGGFTQLRARINFQPSDVQLAALEHGVPLVLRLELDGAAGTLLQKTLSLRYFPLSRRYRLRVGPGDHDVSFAVRGYLFDALERLRLPLQGDPCPPPAPACRLHVRLDYAALPGALRLPALLRPAWRVPAASAAVDAS